MEEQRDIPGFPGLKATSYGRIIGKKGKEIGSVRHIYFSIAGRCLPPPYTTISRGNLILRAFKGPPPPDKPEVDHIDRNKHNDRPENLRWSDRYEQMQNISVHKDSTSQIKGLSEYHYWFCSIAHKHKKYTKTFPFDQKDAAIAWLTAKRIELNL